ncbi:MAG TPA: peptidoglycan bridge formation glycyltransferase FemA/FemB family protein [Spirochaetales bacterium]|mgnify:FL=1|nr:peptidoglycan bridge formation glycyltransferase FemA/FemB family protein [Spirochaetales bacterium]
MRLTLTENQNAIAPVFLQSRFWADFKVEAGWSYVRYDARLDDGPYAGSIFTLTVMERGLGVGFRFAYVPHGPSVALEPAGRTELLVALAKALRGLVSGSCLFIRFDPAWYEAEDASGEASSDRLATPPRPVFSAPLRKASDVQPPDSVVLDIARPDDDLLAGMKPKWRYNIRLAEKKGVTVASEGAGSLGEFYALYEATAARDRIAIHPASYYERLFGLEVAGSAEPKPDIRLWMARHEGLALAGIVTVFYGDEATYLYGASGNEHRNLMPAYALQWAAVKAARDAGCRSYDFYGIPPTDDPKHAMSGLYRFKTGFGGEIRHYAGAWDYVLRPAAYAAFRAAERARLFWHKALRKRLGR